MECTLISNLKKICQYKNWSKKPLIIHHLKKRAIDKLKFNEKTKNYIISNYAPLLNAKYFFSTIVANINDFFNFVD